MATPGERRALLFLVAVAVLGAGTRAVRAKRAPVATEALDGQITAVEQAVGRPGARGSGRNDRRGRAADSVRAPTRQPVNLPIRQSAKVDLDTAPAEEVETLPGIGPALAKRIVADRDANGPFGCVAGLDRVKGIGPALIARIDSLATFSYLGRPGCNH
jgi:competence protein ComEA